LLHRISFNSLHCSFAAQHKHLSPKLGHYFFGCPVYYYFITAFGIISATNPFIVCQQVQTTLRQACAQRLGTTQT
jgi:hypothetical protein